MGSEGQIGERGNRPVNGSLVGQGETDGNKWEGSGIQDH